MAITIEHVYSTPVYINYYAATADGGMKPWALYERIDYEDMDTVAEHVCDVLVKHNFCCADVCDTATGEIIMILRRS